MKNELAIIIGSSVGTVLFGCGNYINALKDGTMPVDKFIMGALTIFVVVVACGGISWLISLAFQSHRKPGKH